MEWVYDVLRITGFALLVLGGWSLSDSLARMAKVMERKQTEPGA
jgi:hypothetical protein